MLTRGKGGAVEPGRVVEVVAVSYAVEMGGGPQALGGCGRLLAGMVASVFFVGSGVVSGAVKAERHVESLFAASCSH